MFQHSRIRIKILVGFFLVLAIPAVVFVWIFLFTETLAGLLEVYRFVIGIGVLFFILFVLVAGDIVYRSIMTPLNTLKKESQKIAEGAYFPVNTDPGKDEIGVVRNSVRGMAVRLIAFREEAEQKNSELQKTISELTMARDAMNALVDDLQKEKLKADAERSKDEAILAAIGEGIIATDQDGKIVVINAAAQGFLGLSSEDVVGKAVMEVLEVEHENGDAIPVYERPAVVALSSGQKVAATISDGLYYKKTDGTRFPVQVTVAPYELHKKIVGSAIVFRDMTHEFAVDKAKSEFVSLASHQLRTPLSTINWYAEMLLGGDAGKLKKEQKEYLNFIYESNQRLVSLVNALLNVSRLELGTFSVEPEIMNLVETAQSVLKELEPDINRKKIVLKEEYKEDVPTIKADPNLLRIVFQNLLSNAVKYTPDKGEVSIKMSLVKKTKDLAQSVQIVVSDTGYGIPKEQHEKIFSKLFRADNVKAKEVEGTGLGLYIVKSIIDHSGGTVGFESEEDKGTVFTVTLPTAGMRARKGSRKLQ